MKAKAKRKIRTTDSEYWTKGDTEETRIDSREFCCGDMAEAWEENFIHFGETDGFLNRDENINIAHCSPYPEGAVFDEMAINFCPFCATKIEIEIS